MDVSGCLKRVEMKKWIVFQLLGFFNLYLMTGVMAVFYFKCILNQVYWYKTDCALCQSCGDVGVLMRSGCLKNM